MKKHADENQHQNKYNLQQNGHSNFQKDLRQKIIIIIIKVEKIKYSLIEFIFAICC